MRVPALNTWEPAMRATKKPAIAGFFAIYVVVARMAGSHRVGSYMFRAGSYIFSAIAAFIAAIVAA